MKWMVFVVLFAGAACDNSSPTPQARAQSGTGGAPLPEQKADTKGERDDVGDVKPRAAIDRNVEDRLTISQGVYGQTSSQDDVGDHNPVESLRMSLGVFPPGGKGEALTTVRSDEVGFYEIPLAPGSYSLCTSFKRCTKVSVRAGECVRLDYEFSAGPGWSHATPRPCPSK